MTEFRDRLISALKSNAVVTIVGTGASKAMTKNSPEADWIGLIRSGIRQVVQNDSKADRWMDLQISVLDLAIETSDISSLIGVAGQVAARLKRDGDQPYIDWLRETVGSLKVRAPELPGAIASLQTPILTTNYDHLLESALHRQAVSWRDREAMREIFRTDSNAIGHLHGEWKNADSVILSPEDYSRILADDPAQILESAHYTSKSFLFVGYGSGLNDPNFSNLLRWHRKLFPQSRGDHFRLCTEDELQTLTEEHVNDDIRVVSYGSVHSDLPSFLRGLTSDKKPSRSPSGLGRDAVAFAREAIIEQIRAETVIGDSVDDIDERELSDITVKPVLLPMPHEQFVNARSVDGDIKPERINADEVHVRDKVLILAAEELSGLTTALRWIVAHAALNRARTAPIFVDARSCVPSAKPLDRQIRMEAYNHGLIPGKKDALPPFVLAVDNVKPQNSREYTGIISDISTIEAPFVVIGCREGDEAQIVEDLSDLNRQIEVAYIGKLGSFEVREFARILAPNRPATICDSVMKVVRTERLPRTPFTVALLFVLLSQGSTTNSINNSETAVLEQYVNLLLGRSGPFLDPRHYLDPQNREVVLSQFAKELVVRRKGAMTQADAVKFIAEYFVSRDWSESAAAALENFRRMRLLRVEGDAVQFQQTSYLHLFAAKAATRDPEFLKTILADPLYFSPIIRHYAALVRDSEEVVLRMQALLEEYEPEVPGGRFYGSVEIIDVEDTGEAPDEEDEAQEGDQQDGEPGSSVETTDAQDTVIAETVDEYDESSDADRIPFPLDDPSTWPTHTRLSASLLVASRVLRDSDDLSNLDIKSEVFKLVLSRWGYLAQILDDEKVFEEVATAFMAELVRAKFIKEQDNDRYRDGMALMFVGFSLYTGIVTALASRKLIRTYERVRQDESVRNDPHSAIMLALFAFDVRLSDWPDEMLELARRHTATWSTARFMNSLARVAWEDEPMTAAQRENVREFLRANYVSKHKFPNDRTKKIRLKLYDQQLNKSRSKGRALAEKNAGQFEISD